jgi:hypothetical protein
MSSGASSNAAAVKAQIAAFVKGIDFTRPGKEGSLGKDLLSEAATGIIDQAIGNQQSPDGTPFAANQGPYGDAKREEGLPVGIGLKGHRGGSSERMLSLVEVMGEQDIKPDEATMKYGRSEAMKRRGQWFTAGSTAVDGCEPSGAMNQPSRPFYGLGDETKANVREVGHDFVRDRVREWNAKQS